MIGSDVLHYATLATCTLPGTCAVFATPESLLHDVVEASKKKKRQLEQGVTACLIFSFFFLGID